MGSQGPVGSPFAPFILPLNSTSYDCANVRATLLSEVALTFAQKKVFLIYSTLAGAKRSETALAVLLLRTVLCPKNSSLFHATHLFLSVSTVRFCFPKLVLKRFKTI